MDTAATDPVSARTPATPGAPAPSRRRRRLALDLTLLAIVGVLLIAAAGAGAAAIYREFYSPTAFVERYLGLLAEGRAADALAVPGVAVDSAELEAAGLPATASDALLRRDALATLTDIEITVGGGDRHRQHPGDGRATTRAPSRARPRSRSQRDGWVGVAPTWTFATEPARPDGRRR